MIEIRCPLHEAGYVSKSSEGLICSEGTLSFYEYNQVVSLTASNLRNAGVVAGDHVGLLLYPDWRGAVLLFALIRVGAVACPLNLGMDEGAIKAALQCVSGNKLIASDIAWAEKLGSELTVLEAEVLARMGGIDESGVTEEKIPGDRHTTALVGLASDGVPRAVVNTYSNHYYSALGCNANFDLRSHDKWMLTAPLSNPESIGIIFRAAVSGGALVVPGPHETLTDAIQEYGTTHISLDPAAAHALFEGSEKVAKTLKVIAVDGEPSPETVSRAAVQNVRVCACYSLPEMASVVTSMYKVSGPSKFGTRGGILKYREVRVDSGRRVQVRGHTLFAGYLRGGEIERELTEDGWFVTDDRGALDLDGYLVLED